MTLRCKSGDIAIITQDYPDCQENLGRLVDVLGPMRVTEAGPSWLIRPVTPKLYTLHESDHTVCRERVTWRSRVTHPDAWMVPIRPGEMAGDEQGEVTRPEPAAALAKPTSTIETNINGV